jgi:hypothetical protein
MLAANPAPLNTRYALHVVDARVDKQTYMTAITYASEVHMYPLQTEPAIEVALDSQIKRALEGSQVLKSVEVKLEELDFKNKVGFGIPDDQQCKIESKLTTLTGDKEVVRQVKTLARDNTHMGSRVVSMAKVMLDVCLSQHAREIAQVIKNQQ